MAVFSFFQSGKFCVSSPLCFVLCTSFSPFFFEEVSFFLQNALAQLVRLFGIERERRSEHLENCDGKTKKKKKNSSVFSASRIIIAQNSLLGLHCVRLCRVARLYILLFFRTDGIDTFDTRLERKDERGEAQLPCV